MSKNLYCTLSRLLNKISLSLFLISFFTNINLFAQETWVDPSFLENVSNQTASTAPPPNPGQPNTTPVAPPNPGQPNTTPVNPPTTPIEPGTLNDAIGIFSAKCIFPHSAGESGMGGAEESCAVEDSVVGILIGYLQNIIPFLAVLVMVWAGYLYYGSANSGNNKQAITAIRGAAGGLVLLLISNIVASFFTDSASKNGKTGLQVLTGTDSGDKGSVLGFITQSLLLPLFQMLQYAAGAFAVFSFVYAGYLYILSNMNGDSGMTKKAKVALKNAIIGFFLVMLAVTIIAFIQNYLVQFEPAPATNATP